MNIDLMLWNMTENANEGKKLITSNVTIKTLVVVAALRQRRNDFVVTLYFYRENLLEDGDIMKGNLIHTIEFTPFVQGRHLLGPIFCYSTQ